MTMNLPNTLTLVRMFLVPLLVVVLLTQFAGREIFGVPKELIGAAIFGIASITDWLDGYLARRRRQVTWLGQVLDPIADKLLTSAAFISLVQLGLAPAWMVALDHRPRVRDHRSAQPRLHEGHHDSRVPARQDQDGVAGDGHPPADSRMAAAAVARADWLCGALGGDADRRGLGDRLLPAVRAAAQRARHRRERRTRAPRKLSIQSLFPERDVVAHLERVTCL